MAEKSKFAGLAELKDPLPAQAPAEDETAPHTKHERGAESVTRQTGPVLATAPPKPAGKRSDPAWKQFSVLLKIKSQEEATERLRKKYKGTDFSELLQALLDQWLRTV